MKSMMNGIPLDDPNRVGAPDEEDEDEHKPQPGDYDYDPTPWCSYCGSMTPRGCDCGPIAENE